jgi:hypothetical protein
MVGDRCVYLSGRSSRSAPALDSQASDRRCEFQMRSLPPRTASNVLGGAFHLKDLWTTSAILRYGGIAVHRPVDRSEPA